MNRLLLVCCVVLLVGLGGCLGTIGLEEVGDDVDDGGADDGGANDGPTDPVDGDLELHHIDVGQADSTLIVAPDGETILIDTGDWRQDGQDVIEYLDAEGIDRIDHLVATHPHADHIGGHAAVIEHFETEGDGIGTAYDSGVPHDTATFDRYLDAVEDHDVELLLVEEGEELPLADANVSALFVNPVADPDDDLHDNSVSLVVEFGEFGYVTTGDAETDAEARMVDAWGDDLDATVYQAGHHGSTTSSTAPFLDAVDPDVAVISSALESQYGHPHDEVLEDFADRGIETYWTGVHGDVVVTTDGAAVDVEAATEFSTDPLDLLAEKHAAADEDDQSPSIGPIDRPAGTAHAIEGVTTRPSITG